MISAVLDTNVLVSALIRRGGIPDQILRNLSRFELILSEEILQETGRVLRYPRIFRKYGLSAEIIGGYVASLRDLARIVEKIKEIDATLDDPDDLMVLACAVSGKATHLVSGDPHLHSLKEYRGVHLLTPAEFLRLIS